MKARKFVLGVVCSFVLCASVWASGSLPTGTLSILVPRPFSLPFKYISIQELSVLRVKDGGLTEVAKVTLEAMPDREYAANVSKTVLPGKYRISINGQLSEEIVVEADRTATIALGAVMIHDAVNKITEAIAPAILCGDTVIQPPPNKLFVMLPQVCSFRQEGVDNEVKIVPNKTTELFNSPAVRFEFLYDLVDNAAFTLSGSYVEYQQKVDNSTTKPVSISRVTGQREDSQPDEIFPPLPGSKSCLFHLPFGVLSLVPGRYQIAINGVSREIALERGMVEIIKLYPFSVSDLQHDDDFTYQLRAKTGEKVLTCRFCFLPQIEPAFEDMHQMFEIVMIEAGEYVFSSQGEEISIVVP